MLHFYLISQSKNNGYDTYSDAVVIAKTEEEAKCSHPNSDYKWDDDKKNWYMERKGGERYYTNWVTGTWTHPKFVDVQFMGHASELFIEAHGDCHVVCSSFHAG
jgi:hypothetical protein